MDLLTATKVGKNCIEVIMNSAIVCATDAQDELAEQSIEDTFTKDCDGTWNIMMVLDCLMTIVKV